MHRKNTSSSTSSSDDRASPKGAGSSGTFKLKLPLRSSATPAQKVLLVVQTPPKKKKKLHCLSLTYPMQEGLSPKGLPRLNLPGRMSPKPSSAPASPLRHGTGLRVAM